MRSICCRDRSLNCRPMPSLPFHRISPEIVHLSGIVRQGESQLNLLTGGKRFTGFNKCAGRTDIEHKTIKVTTFNHVVCADHTGLAGVAPQGDLSFFRAYRLTPAIVPKVPAARQRTFCLFALARRVGYRLQAAVGAASIAVLRANP